jgi:3-isopropylmalate/(R)-2-methylmalate dehydratase large subunit
MAEILAPKGRVLFLSEDPALIEAQLAGRALSRAEAGKLRDDVSTDEITPPITCLLYDERLGREVLIGLRTGERTPISKDALKGVFCVVVAGRRYGKGSSREHAPLAHLHAGVRLIVAESFERIFRQNADNLGLYTSTDFGLLERLLAPWRVVVLLLALLRFRLLLRREARALKGKVGDPRLTSAACRG